MPWYEITVTSAQNKDHVWAGRAIFVFQDANFRWASAASRMSERLLWRRLFEREHEDYSTFDGVS